MPRARKARGGAPFVAITGTNGKSTTTALIAHILREAGRDVQLGGNIGVPILALEPPDDGRIHVIECSSFQIDLAPSLAPTVGILLNLTPDHIDRHGTMENYAAVKERLVAGAEIALVSVDDAYCHAIGARLTQKARPGQRVAPVSAQRALDWGFYVKGDKIMFASGMGQRRPRRSAALPARALRGAHNAQNAAFAAAAAWELGLDDEEYRTRPAELPRPAASHGRGRASGNVIFVNDSKATNADSASKALVELRRHFLDHRRQGQGRRHRGAAALLSAHRQGLSDRRGDGGFRRDARRRRPFERCGTLQTATAAAAHDAEHSAAAEPVVLLSPACASYDQFPNFEVRGDMFRDLALQIVSRSGRSLMISRAQRTPLSDWAGRSTAGCSRPSRC